MDESSENVDDPDCNPCLSKNIIVVVIIGYSIYCAEKKNWKSYSFIRDF